YHTERQRDKSFFRISRGRHRNCPKTQFLRNSAHIAESAIELFGHPERAKLYPHLRYVGSSEAGIPAAKAHQNLELDPLDFLVSYLYI
ncbi:MAG: hypothetical protein ACE5OR_07265, partial [bacterium]